MASGAFMRDPLLSAVSQLTMPLSPVFPLATHHFPLATCLHQPINIDPQFIRGMIIAAFNKASTLLKRKLIPAINYLTTKKTFLYGYSKQRRLTNNTPHHGYGRFKTVPVLYATTTGCVLGRKETG
jgi:hypothetical protein